MLEYAMSIKDGDGIVFKTKANSLKEAKLYFAKLKDLPEEVFNKLFIVTEIKKGNKTYVHKRTN